ncbi:MULTISPECIES: RDD family protein [Salimicrobium]|uniref:RDD domain-containing protein n=2 Tax=Salimicrobium TaxID=351195 RepID=K2GNQ4_9BACI|nr:MULTISPECIES: RDD family protein [Salimicrobium]AKG03526.1 hypothetical protein AAV35_001160 [Salimicrobium jeotgali]EKE32014.1 RDD domain-containing protein [Salimicrobium jeotgali]MBM7695980.1 putative RDD family membrane protein YckC [Salimicrobium jeotgali]SDX86631.1 Uncharacterized membrane protein YckC, RDD family [Salimicrobium album]
MRTDTPKAGFGKRLAAFLADSFIINMVAVFLYFLITGELTSEVSSSYAYVLLDALYLTILPAVWAGYTLAKRLMGIRVKKLNGNDVTLLDMFIRDFVGKVLLSVITFGVSTLVSFVMVIATKQRRAIHDYMAGTYVHSG